MPAAEIELDDRNESLDRVVDLGNGKEHFGMTHETVASTSAGCWSSSFVILSLSLKAGTGRFGSRGEADLVILSSMLRGSRMKVGRVTRLKSAPGRSWEMMCVRTAFKHQHGDLSRPSRGDGRQNAVEAKYWMRFAARVGGRAYHCPGRVPRRGCRHLRQAWPRSSRRSRR